MHDSAHVDEVVSASNKNMTVLVLPGLSSFPTPTPAALGLASSFSSRRALLRASASLAERVFTLGVCQGALMAGNHLSGSWDGLSCLYMAVSSGIVLHFLTKHPRLQCRSSAALPPTA